VQHSMDISNRSPVLAGRQQELAFLWQHFEEARAGHLRVALVTGEPGIGKTRLLRELAQRAEQQGATILRGGASEAEGMPPYLPFLEALGGYIRTLPQDRLRAQTGQIAPILATIFPEVLLSLGELPASYPLPAEQTRLRLYEAVGMFLAAIAGDTPLILLLDDLQWADPASLDLLSYIAQHQSTARLLILGAYRASELEQNPALGRVLLDLNRSRQLLVVSLGSLSQEEIILLSTHLLGAPLDAAVGRLLYGQSEGNPFFAEELLSTWREANTLRLAAHVWTFQTPLPQQVPAGIVGVVRQRLAHLSEQTVEILHTAAILGRTFDLALLAEVVGQPAEEIEELLLQATQAGLLREAAESFTFSHDKIRECLYAEVTPLRRKRLHGFIGHALETQADQASAQQLASLAFHFARSGDRERGVRYALLAAEQAATASALEDALAHYRMALELLAPHDLQRGPILLHLGETALMAGAEREAITTYEAAQTWFNQHANQQAAAQAAHGLGRAWARMEEHAKARAAFETALAWLQEVPGPRLVEVLVDLATLLAVSLGQPTVGRAYGNQALALAKRLEDAHLQAIAHRTVGNLLMRGNALPEAISLLEQGLALAEAARDLAEAAECCACLTLAYAWNGQLQRSQDITRRRLEFAQQCHEPYQARHVYSWLAALAMMQGNLAEAEHLLAQAKAVVARLTSPEPHAFFAHAQGYIAYYRGDYPFAEEQFRQARNQFRAIGPETQTWYLGPLGLALLAQGKREEALAYLREAEELLAGQPEDSIMVADALSELALLVVRLADRERAARYYKGLLPFQGLYIDLLIERLLGELQLLLGDWPRAQMHLHAAEQIARREGLYPEVAWIFAAQARLALARGGRGSAALARSLFEQALDHFTHLGLSGEAESLRAELQRVPAKSQSRQLQSRPAGLSEREVEVLQLVAAGKSNHQIAEALVLSEKTVANHLLHIFNKIGVDNRAAAAAFAIRQHLA
jgi:predicted ATPase/DNA-binding CsgD family transcriptional regulator